mmetsp:Transcript_16999/g.38179  ORF Transcript_16999/g.38179 Transcript_16999/m.38179 type:complete len:257 (-) Transcript_16999:1216-1986(-)
MPASGGTSGGGYQYPPPGCPPRYGPRPGDEGGRPGAGTIGLLPTAGGGRTDVDDAPPPPPPRGGSNSPLESDPTVPTPPLPLASTRDVHAAPSPSSPPPVPSRLPIPPPMAWIRPARRSRRGLASKSSDPSLRDGSTNGRPGRAGVRGGDPASSSAPPPPPWDFFLDLLVLVTSLVNCGRGWVGRDDGRALDGGIHSPSSPPSSSSPSSPLPSPPVPSTYPGAAWMGLLDGQYALLSPAAGVTTLFPEAYPTRGAG